MSKLRWYAVAITVLFLGLALLLADPAIRGSLRHQGTPEPATTPSVGAGEVGCPVSELLVPRCGAWWGAAPGVFTGTPPIEALRDFEAKTGQRARIYHRYHRGDDLFPTRSELAAARDREGSRILLINWKVAWNSTWADVAAGGQDHRIDRLARHIRSTFPEKFFLAIHHEPENDVDLDPGSGMTPEDYAAMYRHTVQRLRDQGVENAVFVMAYMGYQGWGVKPWFGDLYPGDDVVDWIGYDPYVSADPDAHHHGDFAELVNQTTDPDRWPGFYNWARKAHPDKPLMLSEWGVFEYAADPGNKREIFASVQRQLPDYPALKALVYFDSPRAPRGDTRIDSSPQALAAFRVIANLPVWSILRPYFTFPLAPSVSLSASASPTVPPSPSGTMATRTSTARQRRLE